MTICVAASAMEASQQRLWPEAERLWKIEFERSPDNVEVVCRVAQALMEQRKFEEADSNLTRAISRFPENEWPHIYHAWVAVKKEDWKEALLRWQTMQRHFADHWIVPTGIGEALRELGRFDEADAFLSGVIARFPDYEMPAIQRGWVAMRRGDWVQALERWDAILVSFPDCSPALVGKAESLMQLRRFDESDTLLEEALIRFPNDPTVHNLLATLTARRKTPAQRVLDRVHESDIEAHLMEDYIGNPEVMIEITSICNFACSYCVSPMKFREKKLMTMETFRGVLDQVAPMTTRPIRLHVDGEPTTHPQFLEMAKLVNSYGRVIWLATNGSHLDPIFLDIEMGMLISMSTCPEELADRHKRLEFNTYIERIVRYISEWAKSSAPQDVSFQIMNYPQASPEEEVQYKLRKDAFLTEFCRRANVYEYCVEDGTSVHENVYRLKRKGTPGILNFMKQTVVQDGLCPKDGKLVERDRATVGFCDSPWRMLTIHSDGTLGACCSDLSGGTSFATPDEVERKSIKELWETAPRIQSMREAFLEGRVEREVCQRCLVNEQVAIVER